MDYSAILVGCLSFLVGAGIASVVTIFIARANSVNAEASLRSERDIANAAVEERKTEIVDLNRRLEDATKSTAAAAALINQLQAANGRLEGEQRTLVDLKTELQARNRKVEELNNALQRLEATNSALSTLNEQIEKSNADTVAAMRKRVDAELAAKDRELDARLNAAADNHRRELALRAQSLEEQLKIAQVGLAEQKKLLERTELVLTEKFGAVSLESLKVANDEFLKLMTSKLQTKEAEADAEIEDRKRSIDEIVKPLKESLEKLDERQREIEEKRLSAYDGISGQVEKLLKETGLLSNALSRPQVRGNWGEITLRTVADNAGLIEGQDYELQTSFNVEDGRLRPDMIVRLPKKRALIIDSKVPMDAYRQAMEATTDAERAAHLERHCRAVREHIKALSSKHYSSQVEGADFVLMFLPTEAMYHAAIQHDPELINYALKMNVIPANPVTLICSLKSVAYILDIERLNQSANEIKEIGTKLYDGIRVLSTHFASLGKSINSTVTHYNEAVGSLERNALSKARQLRDKGIAATKELAEITEVSGIASSFGNQELIRYSAGNALPEAEAIIPTSTPPLLTVDELRQDDEMPVLELESMSDDPEFDLL